MTAVITGASSGLGRDMAQLLAKRGYDLVLVARRKERLEKLKKELPGNVDVIALDLSKKKNCFLLYDQVKQKDVRVVINNAGFGVFGTFEKTSIEAELSMINTNIHAVHLLTKLFLKDFLKKDRGYILNVSSFAAFQPGPLMASYYASKAYVLHLTQAIREELRHRKSHVYIGVLCPGPFDTEFNEHAHVRFTIPGLKSNEIATYAIEQMFRRKGTIIPGTLMKTAKFIKRFLPDALVTHLAYYVQKRQ